MSSIDPRISRALFLLLLVAASACEEDRGEGPFPGRETSTPRCTTLGSDPDQATTDFVASSLHLLVGTNYNLDLINNAPRGGPGGGIGPSVAGCGEVDAPFGLDLGLGAVATELEDTLGLPSSSTTSVDGPTPAIPIHVRLDHLSSSNVPTDPCVGAELRVGGEEGTSFHASGEMVDGVASLSFDGPIVLRIPLAIPVDSCVDTGCDPGATLSVTILRPYATLSFDREYGALLPGSMLVGHLLVGASAEEFASPDTADLRASIDALVATAGLTEAARDAALAAVVGARDLRTLPDGTLVPCSDDDGANAIAVALSLASAE